MALIAAPFEADFFDFFSVHILKVFLGCAFLTQSSLSWWPVSGIFELASPTAIDGKIWQDQFTWVPRNARVNMQRPRKLKCQHDGRYVCNKTTESCACDFLIEHQCGKRLRLSSNTWAWWPNMAPLYARLQCAILKCLHWTLRVCVCHCGFVTACLCACAVASLRVHVCVRACVHVCTPVCMHARLRACVR